MIVWKKSTIGLFQMPGGSFKDTPPDQEKSNIYKIIRFAKTKETQEKKSFSELRALLALPHRLPTEAHTRPPVITSEIK
tara:strand:+ start:118 stop:354 length:237 start_codon:yes stop_codon:yes gene_type:complete